MNENAALWVEDLLSGDYPQGKGKLRRMDNGEDGFCCLGVACETFSKATGKGEWVWNEVDSYWLFRIQTDVVESEDENYLPDEVVRWLGFREGNNVANFDADSLRTKFDDHSVYISDGPIDDLAAVNDRQGATFELIARIVKAEPKGLFSE